jgi:L-fucose isomerase-like protein
LEENQVVAVLSGGTEAQFVDLVRAKEIDLKRPVYLMVSGYSNSLAAALEILSYIRQRNGIGKIMQHPKDTVFPEVSETASLTRAPLEKVLKNATKQRLGVVGAPSNWLIASGADYKDVLKKMNCELVDIPITEVSSLGVVDPGMPGAEAIYERLKEIIAKYKLDAITLRCFDLLSTVKNTGCMALAKLNAEGYVAGCEGDIPALLSMIVGKSVSGRSGFQANPSCMDLESGEFVFSHCTVPLDMVSSFSLDTHFESGIGVGIHGELPLGPVTVFKVSGDLSRHFACEGELLRNEYSRDLCRTQVVLRLPDQAFRYFLTDPIGNHHVIFPGHCAAALEELLK